MDHTARAEALRQRAVTCRSSAQETTSSVFQKCYRLLAEHYTNLAKLEDDYAAGSERLSALAPHRDDDIRSAANVGTKKMIAVSIPTHRATP